MEQAAAELEAKKTAAKEAKLKLK